MTRPGHNLEMDEHWIVDAMNVIGSRPDGWWMDRKGAMRDFAHALDGYAAASGTDMTVVFDSDPGDLPEITHIEVVIARERGPNSADHEIERLVEADQDPEKVRVVTSDRALSDAVKALGAQIVSAGTFRAELER